MISIDPYRSDALASATARAVALSCVDNDTISSPYSFIEQHF